MKINLKGLEYVLLILGLYTEVMAEAIIVLLVALLVYMRGGKLVLNKNLILVFGVLFVWSLSTIVMIGYSPNKFFQQFILLFFFYSTYYIIFSNNRDDIDGMFQVYLKFTYFLCITAIIQFALFFLTGINIFYVLNIGGHSANAYITPRILRVTSICAEPSNFSRLITPALAFYMLGEIKNRLDWKHFFVIFTAMILTFSTMSYIIMFFILVYKYAILKRNLFFRVTSVVIAAFLFLLIFNVINEEENVVNEDKGALSDISMKIRDITKGFQDLDPESLELLNLSSYATMTNVWVAMNADNRISGTGLGTHEQNYESKYQSNFKYYGLNKQEGYALGNRLYSEFGFFGLILFGLFLWKCHNKDNIINISIFFFIFTLFFRGGHYTRYGAVFFFMLYFFTSKYYNTEKPLND